MALPIDIGIITIIPTEVDAVFRSFGIDRERDFRRSGNLEYWSTAMFSSANGGMIRLAASFVSGNAGNTESAILTTMMAEKLTPRLMCLVGIAAGARGKISIGDVILPDVVHDVTVSVRKNGTTQPRSRQYSLDQRLARMLKLKPFNAVTFAGSLPWKEEDLKQLKATAISLDLAGGDIASEPQLADGSVVSGNTLLRDSTYFPQFQSTNDERCKAGEMEAAGFARASELAGLPWLTIRGISDYGDSKKSDDFQRFAATNAAVALRQLLDRNISLATFPRNPHAIEDYVFADSLESSIGEEYSRSNWNIVVEIGAFLSRPLWLSGKLDLRQRLGRLVEDAAAKSDRISDRARALIDDIGWTSAALANTPDAKKAIHDGLRLAQEVSDSYLAAKAHRHLASIARQEGALEACETELGEAEAEASRITDDPSKTEMLNSLLVSRAKLCISRGDPANAVSLLEAARREFEAQGDYLRAAKTYHSLGLAYSADSRVNEAVESHEHGYSLSISLGRKDEALANASALALLLATEQPEDALRWALRSMEVASDLPDARLDSRILALALTHSDTPPD